MVPFAKPYFSKSEEQAVLRVLRSGQLSQGQEVERFEHEFARYLGVKHAIALFNGTAALHLSLLALGIGPDDEVITTPFSFIASTSAILYVGGKPVFVDIGADYNLDPALIEEKITQRTKAILPVHLFGNPCDMDAIMAIAKRHNLLVIEDACQAHGAVYRGKPVGTFGTIGCFSFYATKNMTTGEGGMIVTNSSGLVSFLRMARSHGSRKRYYHSFLGYNYRMTEIQAVIGRAQLKKLPQANAKRISHAHIYNRELADIPGLVLPQVKKDTTSVFHHYTVRLTGAAKVSREQLWRQLERRGIQSGIYYPLCIHQQKQFRDMGFLDKLPQAERASREVLSLPIHPQLGNQNILKVAAAIREVLL